ncbi:MAG TPA: peptidoglycan-binding domain-containing protein [Polyangiaceae bacterium]|nr:peptidoglycan-binding domain-containing protein [Polyangiaceae bacterium]
MPLRSLVLKHARLSAASLGGNALRFGEQGEAVSRLQLALIALGQALPLSTRKQSKLPDGQFGPETLAAVKALQRQAGLTVDGVVGPLTLRHLDASLPTQAQRAACCSNGDRLSQARSSSPTFGANFRAAFAGSASIGGITLPSGVRFLTSAQESAARSVFGSSLDFTRILLSDATGAGGRPFTVAVPIVASVHVVVINAGTFTPSRGLLIHELAHAWQSQHSLNPTQFMVNSIASQAIADELLSRFGADASAYYYRPGKSFALYGAEQTACQVEGGVSAAVAFVRSLPPHLPHPLNDLGLAVPHWEVNGPGVVTRC